MFEGEVLMDTFDLEVAKSPSSGYHLEYNDELPAATLNSVGSAILPFLLSMLPPKINYYDSVSDIYLPRYVFFTSPIRFDGLLFKERKVCIIYIVKLLLTPQGWDFGVSAPICLQ